MALSPAQIIVRSTYPSDKGIARFIGNALESDIAIPDVVKKRET